MQTRKNENAILNSMRELKGKDKTNFDEICHLAFSMTKNSKQAVFSQEVSFFKHVGIENASFLGLITIDHTAKSYGNENSYSFVHLTLQEYLAAWYVAHLDGKEQTEIIRLLAHDSHMQMVWMFYCGMVEFGGKPAQMKLIIQNQEGNALHKIRCAFESQQKFVCDSFFESGQVSDLLRLNNNTLTPVSYVISNTSHSVKSIHMSHCSLHDKHIKAFLMGNSTQILKNIEELNVSHNSIGPEGIQTLAHSLSCGNKMKVLHLSENIVGADGIIILTGALKYCNKLEELDLSQNNIGPDGAFSLACAFKSYAKARVFFDSRGSSGLICVAGDVPN